MNTESIRKSNPLQNQTTLNTRPIFNHKTHKKRGIVRETSPLRVGFESHPTHLHVENVEVFVLAMSPLVMGSSPTLVLEKLRLARKSS